MTANFGICFFLFDRLFGTLRKEHSRFNRQGHAAALRRYAYVFPGNAPGQGLRDLAGPRYQRTEKIRPKEKSGSAFPRISISLRFMFWRP